MSLKLRVWHIANVPNKPFRVNVTSLEQAKFVLTALADYDLHLGEELIFSNAQGLEVYDDGEYEWVEWTDDDGDDIRATKLTGASNASDSNRDSQT